MMMNLSLVRMMSLPILLCTLCGLGSTVVLAKSEMIGLDDSELEDVSAQAGADLSLKLTLNHDSNANFDNTLCSDLRFCRLGVSLNNRYHDGTQDTVNATTGVITPSATGRKQWLVFKGIQGTINIKEIKLDGADITYGTTTQAAIQLGFTATKPIEIRNLGFKALSIETDTVAAEGAGNVPGYLTPATLYGGVGFDADKEKGFLGLNVNANLSLTGSIKVFSCSGGSGGNPRC
jgi:hypothetical protein